MSTLPKIGDTVPTKDYEVGTVETLCCAGKDATVRIAPQSVVIVPRRELKVLKKK